MPQAAEIMVREGASLKEAVTQLGIPLTSEECITIVRRASFRKLIRDARTVYHAELGGDPKATKDVLVGQMLSLAEKLEASGDSDKAAEVLFKVARIRNFVGDQGQVNVFAGLTQKDLDTLKKEVAARVEATERPN